VRTPRDTPEITLVGAGLAGSLLAIFLARRGYRVTLLERRLDPRKTAASAGRSINLALANRGISALEEVGVMESVRSALIPMAGRMLHDEEGRLRLIPYGNKPHEVIYSVSRGGLNTLLLNAAESTGRVLIRFGETVCGVDFADRKLRFLAGEAPRRFAPRSWNGEADSSTRSRSATGTRNSRFPRRQAANFAWRRTPCISGREANTC
jgi:2-polyprenyl-6-methoxyphenol hydroxylase-like FAD-dependent oxidoreductase